MCAQSLHSKETGPSGEGFSFEMKGYSLSEGVMRWCRLGGLSIKATQLF
jgi:hypothetical protein